MFDSYADSIQLRERLEKKYQKKLHASRVKKYRRRYNAQLSMIDGINVNNIKSDILENM